MASTASDVMQREPHVASPSWDVATLERAFVAKRCTGFPVVGEGCLVGVVSRSDIVRRLAVEQAREGEISDFFREFGSPHTQDEASIRRGEARALGERLAGCSVADLMSPPTFVVEEDTPIETVAEILVQHRIHRVPVVAEGRLVGILTTLDLVALLAKPS